MALSVDDLVFRQALLGALRDPAPVRQDLDQLLEAADGLSLPSLDEVLAALEGHPRLEHLRVLVALIRSRMDPERHPWSATLEQVEADWPTFGEAFAMAARRTQSDAKKLELLTRAAHLPVCSRTVLSQLDKLRKGGGRLRALSLLVEERPSIRNLEVCAQEAERTNRREEVARIVEKALRLHGEEPARWDVANRYDELSSAGGMCLLINKVRARQMHRHRHLSHDFTAWNQAAISYLERSLLDPNCEGKNSRYGLIRLCEAYAQRLRRPPPDWTRADEEKLVRRASEVIVKAGAIDPERPFTAYRQKAMVLWAWADRALDRGVSEEELQRRIDAADGVYELVYKYAYRHKREQVREWHLGFLLRFGQVDRARELARDDIGLAKAAKAAGNHAEAIQRLREAFGGAASSNAKVGIACLALDVVRAAEDGGAPLDERLLRMVRDDLRPALDPVVRSGMHALLEADPPDTPRAQRFLDVARFVSPSPTDPRLMSLEARSMLCEGEVSPKRASELFGIAARCHADADLVEATLEMLVVSMPRLDPAHVWRFSSATGDPSSCAAALAWQAATHIMGGWMQRLKWALERWPMDDALCGLPARVIDSGADIAELANLLEYATVPNQSSWSEALVARLPAKVTYHAAVVDRVERMLRRGPDTVDPRSARSWCVALAQWSTEPHLHQAAELLAFPEMEPGWRARLVAWWLESCCEVAAERTADHLIRRLNEMGGRAAELQTVEALERSLEDLQPIPEVGEAPDAPLPAHLCSWVARPGDCWRTTLEELVVAWISDDGMSRDRLVTLAQIHREVLTDKLYKEFVVLARSPLHTLKNSISTGDIRDPSSTLDHHLGQAKRLAGLNRRLHLRRVSLGDVLRGVMQGPPYVPLGRQAPEGQPGVWYRVGQNTWVFGDAPLLEELVRALLHNARQAVRGLGEEGWLLAEVVLEDGEVLMLVRDNGAGADSTVVDKLNQGAKPFSGFGSTGLGTRICSRIAELHGGRITYASPGPDEGMEVRVRLPTAGSTA